MFLSRGLAHIPWVGWELGHRRNFMGDVHFSLEALALPPMWVARELTEELVNALQEILREEPGTGADGLIQSCPMVTPLQTRILLIVLMVQRGMEPRLWHVVSRRQLTRSSRPGTTVQYRTCSRWHNRFEMNTATPDHLLTGSHVVTTVQFPV